jgi:hypothetical protein
MDYDRNNGGNTHFFMTLVVNNLLIHNSMLDFGASIDVIFLKVMNELGLKTTSPYKNACGNDSILIKGCGLLKDIRVNAPSSNLTVVIDLRTSQTDFICSSPK